MKLLRAAYHGLSGFVGGEFDLRDVPPGLVTLTGPNWAGKSTFLELPIAALYREWASRANNDISKWADARDSWVEADLELGDAVYRARVNIDGTTRKAQAVLSRLQPNGSWRALTDGKVSTFDAAILALVPPKDALLCSQFAAQNRAGSLTSQSRAKRKDLFLHFLWLEPMLAMSETAKACHMVAETTAMVLRAQIEQLEKESTPAAEAALGAQLEALRRELEGLSKERETLQEKILTAEAEQETLAGAADEYVSAMLMMAGLMSAVQAAQRELDGVPAGLEKLATQADQDIRAINQRLGATLEDLDAKIEKQQELLQHADISRGAAADMVRAQASIDHMREAAEVSARDTFEWTERLRDATAAELMGTVPCGGAEPFAGCRFLIDAVAARARLEGRTAADCKQELTRLATDDRLRTAARKQAERLLAAVRADAEKVPALDQAAERLDEYQKAADGVTHDAGDRIREVAERMEQAARDLGDRADTLRLELLTANYEIDALKPTIERTEAAKVRSAVLAAQMKTDAAALSECSQKRVSVELKHQEVELALEAIRYRRQLVAGLTPRLREAEDAMRVQGMLARALHRDGLPTLEIAAAAPAISQLTTDLLDHSGFGTRFRVDVTTLVPTADGKEWKEDFAVRVYDNARGKEILDIGDLSGGERILVEEALRAALTIYMAARHTHPVRTCWRDETTGPLDAENRPRYVAMLRRLRQLGGYDHVIVISHAEDVVEQMDTIFDVRDGQATLRRTA